MPVLFPYIELVDAYTWGASQALQWHVITSCVPGASVFSNIFTFHATADHDPYPRGRNLEQEKQALKEVYGKAGMIPNPMHNVGALLEEGNCANHNAHNLWEPADPNENTWSQTKWKTQDAFAKCRAAMEPRFFEFMKTGNLAALDGRVYGTGPKSAEDIRKCKSWHAQYGVVPGASWGQLPTSLQSEWIKKFCDQVIRDGL